MLALRAGHITHLPQSSSARPRSTPSSLPFLDHYGVRSGVRAGDTPLVDPHSTHDRIMSQAGLSRSPPGSPQSRGGAGGFPERPGGFNSPTSPRSSFLGSFMRGRSRAASVTNAVAGAVRGRVGSPTAEAPNPMNSVLDGGADVQRSQSTPGGSADPSIPPVDPEHRRTHRIRLVPVLDSNRSFAFAPVSRDMGVMHVPPGVLPSIAAAAVTDPGPLVNGHPPPLLLKIGRFNDKTLAAAPVGATLAVPQAPSAGPSSAGSNGAASTNQATPTTVVQPIGGGGGDIVSPKAGFRSKVVSRAHAEIWCEPGGKVSYGVKW